MAQYLQQKWGPLPVWAWFLIFTGAVFMYMQYRKKQQAATAAAQQQNNVQGTSSNLGTVPVSNMTTAAQPMPIQLGNTFVSGSGGVGTTSGAPNTTALSGPTAPANNLQAAGAPMPSPATSMS